MFHTPCFGEDEFDFFQSRIEPLKSGSHSFNSAFNSNHSVLSEALFSSPPSLKTAFHQSPSYNFLAQQNHLNTAPPSNYLSNGTVVLSRNSFTGPSVTFFGTTPKMTTHRDSILESLGNIAPKFPPPNIDIPDISMTGSSNMPVSSSVEFPGISATQMYGNANLTGSLSTAFSNIAPQSGVNTISPSNSSKSTSSPMRESSDDSDDSVPLAQVRKMANSFAKQDICTP